MFATNSEINHDFMLDTLSFSQNMQKAGMAKDIADILAINIKNLQISQIENLLTKNEFRIFEKEMNNFQNNMDDFKKESKADTSQLRQEVRADISELRTEIFDFKKEVKTDISELRTEIFDFKKEVKTDISEIRTEIFDFKKEVKLEMHEFKNEIKTEMHEFKNEIKTEMHELKIEVRTDIAKLRTEMGEFKEEINNKIECLVTKKEFYSELNKLSLNLTIRLGTIMITGIGIISFFLKLK
jgi:gas vesicle protein